MDPVFLKSLDGRVLLDFPDKDLVFVEDASKAEAAVLSWGDVQTLLEPKNFSCWRRFTPSGESDAGAFSLRDHFLFKGNNLLVLASILPVFRGSVQLIYIDPPYNTGNTFVYKDKMSRALWLLFMKNRLEISKEFLTGEGILVVQCDENEQAYLKVLLDELFGENCFIGMVTVLTNPGGRDYRSLARTHEYLLFYGRNPEAKLNPLPRIEAFPCSDALGGFELRSLRNGNVRFHIGNRPNLCYPFYVNTGEEDAYGLHPLSLEPREGWIEVFPKISQGIQTVWRWGRAKAAENLNINLAARASRGSYLIFEKYRKQTRLPRTVWDDKDFQTSKGTRQLKEMFGASVFDYPKPEALIRHIITLASSPGDRVMDFFLGSGTTAAAAHKEGRLWLGVEQMGYIDTVTIPRLSKVLQEKGGAFTSAKLSSQPFLKDSSDPETRRFYALAPKYD